MTPEFVEDKKSKKDQEFSWSQKKELAEYLGVRPESVNGYNDKKLRLMILGLEVLKTTNQKN